MKFKNYVNPYSKSNRIYSQNDIANMPVKEAFKREKEIVAQDDRIGVPSDMELRNSENVIWVEEYRRDDGKEVKGHWRSKPGRGSIVSTQEDDYGIIEENPTTGDDIMDKSEDEQWVDFGMDITDIIFGDSKITPLITLLAPVIRFLLGKFFSDEEDDSENTRDDSTNTQTPATQSPQDKTPTQNNPTDQNQEQEPTQDKPDIGTTTGGASEVDHNTDLTNEQNTPTLEATITKKMMFPDEVAGVKRGEPKTFEQMMQQGVNPKFMSEEDEDWDYLKNCQSCTVAAELVIRGYNVEAGPYSTSEAKELSSPEKSAYIDPNTGRECIPQKINVAKYDCYDYIDKTVKIGERYEFAYHLTPEDGTWADTESHVVLLTRLNNGNLLIFDPQDGKFAEGSYKAKLYIDSVINEHNTEFDPNILRVDDKALNPKYVNKVVKKRL